MTRTFFLITSSMLVVSCSAALNCNEGSSCQAAAPCCSEYGVCGTTAMHCGGGCQSAFSFPDTCYADRIGTQCVSGDYDFKEESTWIMNADAWNGDPHLADFLVDPQFIPNMELQNGGGIALYLSPPATAGQPGDGCRLSTTSYMLYGVFTARLKSGAAPGGMVTSFISLSDERDEIDWEWVGGKPKKALTAFFHRGNVTRDDSRGEDFDTDLATNEHSYEYSVDWNAERIIWSIDGVAMRTITYKSRGGSYPNTPSRIQLGVWDAGASDSIWTQIWAGGKIDWSLVGSKGYPAVIDYVSIRCAGDTTPTGELGTPDRKEGFTAPSLNEIPINKAHVSAGTSGTDYFEPGTPLSERFTSRASIRSSSSAMLALLVVATFLTK